MPPKNEKNKKGAAAGNYKAGKPLKDIMPAGSKPPREGTVVRMEGESDVNRVLEYEPLPQFPEWPGNEEAKNHDYTSGCTTNEQGEQEPFKDEQPFFMPPSFKEFMRDEEHWLRPSEYLREVLAE